MASSDQDSADHHDKKAADDPSGTEKGPVAEVIEPVKREADALAQHARRSAETLAQESREAAADYVWALSAAVRSGADELSSRHHRHAANVIGQAAEDVDQLARTLADRGPREAVSSLNDFASRHPVMFFGAAALAGAGLIQLLATWNRRD